MPAVAMTDQWRQILPPIAIVQTVRTAPVSHIRGWVAPTIQAIARHELLPDDWDEAGSPQITIQAGETARDFIRLCSRLDLKKPQVFPVSGGGLGFHFRYGNSELDLEVLPDGGISYYLSSEHASGDNQELEGDAQEADAAYAATALLRKLIATAQA